MSRYNNYQPGCYYGTYYPNPTAAFTGGNSLTGSLQETINGGYPTQVKPRMYRPVALTSIHTRGGFRVTTLKEDLVYFAHELFSTLPVHLISILLVL